MVSPFQRLVEATLGTPIKDGVRNIHGKRHRPDMALIIA